MNPSAKEILESKAFKKAVENTEKRMFDDWRRGESTAHREALWHKAQATEALTRELRILADDPAARRKK